MVLSGFRSVVLLCLFTTFISCQKELDENAYETCLLDKVEVFEGNASTPSEVYQYFYDPVTLKFSGLSIDVPAIGYSREAAITVSGTHIGIEGLANIELDGSRRITHLETIGNYPRGVKGDYFFGYNSTGFLEERLFDDGDLVLERTVYKNDGTGLQSFQKSYELGPVIASGVLTYDARGSQPANVLFPYGDVFPELIPFFPLIRLGKISSFPLESVTETIQRPASPPLTAEYLYNGYDESPAGSLQSFQSRIEITGQPEVNKKFRFTYTCR